MDSTNEKKEFICGVIEGFYGRPWTTEQRKDLFRKLKKWGMGAYVYAPKDDYKHRAFWRELYTVEEADHLSSLIAAAKEHGVRFYYALSPGLDMTYSSQKEIQTLKRKLDQVSQFGCEAFALLFDDIEPELSKADKEVFQTFGNAQVSVTNEIFTHLGSPNFLFCPTQYCSTRAIPTVHDSEYLNTLGSKLNHDIDIMWTGNKVISKTITLEAITEVTEVLRRPPVIWDNLHANDYDQKRVFLGPYSGRSPELIPHLRGVMTNPNCEFHANTIAIHTLAHWSQCSLDSKMNSSLSADIKLETENEDGSNAEELPVDCCSAKNVYHPRVALKNAIIEWLPEFFIEKEAWGPITKPQPQVTMVMPIIPIIPSINTCMSLTTTTTTSTNTKTATVPEVNTTQLQALADVCSTVNSSSMNPIANPVMNSLVSPTKVITNDDIINPIPTTAASNIELPKTIPISIVPMPIMQTKVIDGDDVNGGLSSELNALVSSASNHKDSNSDITIKNNVVDKNKEPAVINDAIEMKNIENNSINSIIEPISDMAVMPIQTKTLDDDIAIEEEKSFDCSNNLETVGSPVDSTVPMLEENNLSPLSAGNEPMECCSVASQISPREERKAASNDDVIMAESTSANEEIFQNSMQVESIEPSPLSNSEMRDDTEDSQKNMPEISKINAEDLSLLCDLFYLPFEHGSRGQKLLHEFNWLKANANVLLSSNGCGTGATSTCTKKSLIIPPKPEVAEWLLRSERFSGLCDSVLLLLQKIASCANKEICHDLFTYVWEIAGALTLLNAFVKWLSLAHFPMNVYTFTQGTYTWFSKGWKEAFMSGDQEPWVFRGGLIADLQRLMPVDSGNDLFLYKLPELASCDFYLLRPYKPTDEGELNKVCTRFHRKLYAMENISIEESLPESFNDIIADSIVGPFVTLHPEFCIVAYDACNDSSIAGYVAAAVDIHAFLRNVEVCWIPEMRQKYPKALIDTVRVNEETNGSAADDKISADDFENPLHKFVNEFHKYNYECPLEVTSSYPSVLTIGVLDEALTHDQGVIKRLVTVMLAALRSNGCFGVHVRLELKNMDNLMQFYGRAGFMEVYRSDRYVYLGRRF